MEVAVSVVTNVMLHVGIVEERGLEEINQEFEEGTGLRCITNWEHNDWGGTKVPECTVYAGAMNYLDVQGFMERIAAMPWTCPEEVQLFIAQQDDSRFAVYLLESGSWKQLCDGLAV